MALTRVAQDALRVEATLPGSEVAVLASTRAASGHARYQIVRWYTHEGCALPDDTVRVYAPLLAPLNQQSGELVLPLSRGDDPSAAELWLSDARCQLRGPLGTLDAARVSVLTSAVDRRSLLVAFDAASTLLLFDDQRDAALRPLARDVRRFEARAEGGDPLRDVLWLHESGALVARELDGTPRIALGHDVTEYALYDSLAPRVAYVEGGDLYEALPPAYVPALRAEDACAPRYDETSLSLAVPCAAHRLLRVALSTGELERSEPGVYAAQTLGALELEWRDESSEQRFYVTSPSFGRQRITPPFEQDGLVALDETRLLGRTVDGAIAVWSLAEAALTPLLTGVDELLVHTSSLGEASWIVHHDSDREGLGALSTLALPSLALHALAVGVPLAAESGYALVRSDVLGRLPADQPLLVFREDARALSADPTRHAGRLRAAPLGSLLSTALADDVSAFAPITEPFPGFLVSVEEGPRTGLWLAAL